MAELKTQPTGQSVEEFLNSEPDEAKRRDSFTLLEIMRRITGAEPKMWGPAIVGFGDMHYTYASGRQGDWFPVGFSPRKQNLTVYMMGGYDSKRDLMDRLGKFKTGKGCLYIKRLADVDQSVLEELIQRSVEETKGSEDK